MEDRYTVPGHYSMPDIATSISASTYCFLPACSPCYFLATARQRCCQHGSQAKTKPALFPPLFFSSFLLFLAPFSIFNTALRSILSPPPPRHPTNLHTDKMKLTFPLLAAMAAAVSGESCCLVSCAIEHVLTTDRNCASGSEHLQPHEV